MPNARCDLSSGAGDSLRVFTDDRGVATFHLRPSSGGEQVPTDGVQRSSLALTCTDEGGAQRVHAIEFQIDDVDSPAVRREARERESLEAVPHPGATVLPALSAEDAAKMTDGDIHRLGYPPRHSDDPGSVRYQQWLGRVSKPLTVLAPHQMENPGFFHTANSFTHSPNWSGLELTGGFTPAYQYASASGTWPVPTVYPRVGYLDASGAWVGLDNFSLNSPTNVVQDGTAQVTAVTWLWFAGVAYPLYEAAYYTWTEWYPSSPHGTNLAINPGDTVFAEVWISDSADQVFTNGGVGWFYMCNFTSDQCSGFLSAPQPAGITYNGGNAEWILERPGTSPPGVKPQTYATLSDYTTFTMSNLAARDFQGNEHTYNSDTWEMFYMTDPKGNLLSASFFDGNGNIYHQFHNYQ
jgi:hypothetical protein